MEGGIYAEDKCPICGQKFMYYANKGYFCPSHRTQASKRLRVQFRRVRRRFRDYDAADKFLAGLRFKATEGSFDPRDYHRDNPFGFKNYVAKYLKTKEGLKSYQDVRRHLARAGDFFDQANIKNIGYAEIEDFLLSLQGLSEKTKHNYLSSLHAFFTWACRRERQLQMPQFPQVSFQLGWRKTILPEQQHQILNKLYEISYSVNPKIWIGVKWLMTYISIRPGELIDIKEGDFDFNLGVVIIRQPKEKTPKTVPLLPEDIEIVKSFPRALPHVYFFRHGRRKGVHDKTRQKFGRKYLYKWWKKACAEVGVDGVDLYGGTRHSTARAMRVLKSPEQIKRATMHKTNKAFERYFQVELDDIRDLYAVGTSWGQAKTPGSVDK